MSFDLLFIPAVLVGAAGAILDIRTRRLPNWLCAGFAVLAAAALAVAEGPAALWSAAFHATLALVVGMLLFRARIVGGGDAKFYAAAACGLPLTQGLAFLGWTSIAGLLLWLAMFARRVIATRSRAIKGWDVPYGVAIFAGFVATQLSPLS